MKKKPIGFTYDFSLIGGSIAALKSSVIYWIHLLNSKCNSLIFHAYRENLKLNESLCNKLKQLFSIIGFSHIWENQGTFFKI